MRADAFELDVVLKERQQWVVPVYQRHYEWETKADKQIPKLWEDLRDKAEEHLGERQPYPHYFGAIIYSEPSGQPFGSVRKRYLVDGQQRITTFELVLVAFREVAREHDIPDIQDSVDPYLFNEGKGMVDPDKERYKLWPSMHDRQLYQYIVDNPRTDIHEFDEEYFHQNGNLIMKEAPPLLKAYWVLHKEINDFINDRIENDESTAREVLNALLSGFLYGFQVVMIQLDENDDAQEIFASLNGMAKPLSPFDLIRNDVFRRARITGEDDEKLFDEQWGPLEDDFWKDEVRKGRVKRRRADHLISHAVVAETKREVNTGKIATEYQHYVRERHFSTVREELDVLLRHAGTYRGMEELSDPVTSRLAHVLQHWDLSTFHPVVLWINAQKIDVQDKESLFRLLESYIIRRELCGLTQKNYNKVVTTMIRSLSENNADAADLAKNLTALTSDVSRMPSDSEVLEAATMRSIDVENSRRKLRYILEQIEYAKHTKFNETVVDTSNLTIEHVMPKKWAEHWPLPDGSLAPYESIYQATLNGHVLDEKVKLQIESRQQHINTLGNLTLVTDALNPSLSNHPWTVKRERFAESLLVLNREIVSLDQWTEDDIQKRGLDLGHILNELWPATP